MDSRDWQILKILAEEKNITKAAEKLYISQPAITYRIKMMEKEKISTDFAELVTITPDMKTEDIDKLIEKANLDIHYETSEEILHQFEREKNQYEKAKDQMRLLKRLAKNNPNIK